MPTHTDAAFASAAELEAGEQIHYERQDAP
jgi:hypothetical protein